MIIALQGTPGAGKTTACRNLQEKYPNKIIWIHEIIASINDQSSPYDYLENDIKKWQLTQPTNASLHYLIDRDFTSTLAFYLALYGNASKKYTDLKTTVDQHLSKGKLGIADHLFHFTLSAEQSLKRQAASNQKTWQDIRFLKKFEGSLDHILADYYTREAITKIPGSNNEKDVMNIIEKKLSQGTHKIPDTSSTNKYTAIHQF